MGGMLASFTGLDVCNGRFADIVVDVVAYVREVIHMVDGKPNDC